MNGKITCQICGAETHSIQLHLRDAHPTHTLEQYTNNWPDAPLLSLAAQKKLDAAKAMKEASAETVSVEMKTASAVVESLDAHRGFAKRPLNEVFGFGEAVAAKNSRGEPIMINIVTDNDKFPEFVPAVDENYVFDINHVKTVVMGLEMNCPIYLWGHSGVGKTTLAEQVAARTNRATLRIQHTLNTEETQLLGQWTSRGGETIFEPGPLAVAMRHGLTYIADEYDAAMPAVLLVYQPVLEGKPLIIKEADAANRVIRPHPNFRFIATGNTNGVGDETGLYQGTMIQNAANFERFGIVEEIKYMPASQEVPVVVGQAKVAKKDAERLVKFANDVRDAYGSNKISLPISPRAVINAARLGMMKNDFKAGILLAYANRLTRVDREVVMGLAQRIFA